ncbi:MAG: DUF480 domain-containing protein [Holophagae bacterium]|nr:DUF480 domain-containing protein [Holophagae bacterium]
MPRPLDPVELRVMGSLLEKQQTTPEYYPLTLNALVAACNQKSNREPTMELTSEEVRGALERLRADVLVWPVEGARAERWEHNADRSWELDPPSRAIVTELLLRGPQTPGELRGRGERMYAFGSLAEVESVLRRLASGPEPLVVELPRAPGQKESRWTHLLGEPPNLSVAAVAAPHARSDELAERIAGLEQRLETLEQRLGALLVRLER